MRFCQHIDRCEVGATRDLYIQEHQMALVRSFKSTTAERHSVHEEVECTYLSFTAEDGGKYLQLNTWGSDAREVKDRPSQMVQFDAEGAERLAKIIKAAFGSAAASW